MKGIDFFSNGKGYKNCKTVGDVVSELSRLPPGLPVKSAFEDSVDIVVFNRNDPDAHLSFEDGGLWEEQERNDAT